jgi:dienelactone hydrolase
MVVLKLFTKLPQWTITACVSAFLLMCSANLTAHAQVERYLSKGKSIRVEWFRPSADAGKPVVLILYGASGGDDGAYYRGCAQQFADAGFVAGVVHYFDAHNLKWANSAQMSQHFTEWQGTVTDAVNYSQKLFGAKRKVDLFGYSLGAQLALSCASRDGRIAAVSSMSGCFVSPPAKVAKMPPVLMLHGTRDNTVSLQKEKKTEVQLMQLGSPYEVHLYAKQGHCFDSECAQDAVVRTIAFFNRNK